VHATIPAKARIESPLRRWHMTRSTRVLLPLVALVIAACSESGLTRPRDLGPAVQAPGATVITGVVALIEDPTPHLALRQGEAFIPLVGNTADLDGKVGMAIKVAGSFRDDGAFDIVEYWLDDAPGAATVRVAKP
jgi:hypothetical protein